MSIYFGDTSTESSLIVSPVLSTGDTMRGAFVNGSFAVFETVKSDGCLVVVGGVCGAG